MKTNDKCGPTRVSGKSKRPRRRSRSTRRWSRPDRRACRVSVRVVVTIEADPRRDFTVVHGGNTCTLLYDDDATPLTYLLTGTWIGDGEELAKAA